MDQNQLTPIDAGNNAVQLSSNDAHTVGQIVQPIYTNDMNPNPVEKIDVVNYGTVAQPLETTPEPQATASVGYVDEHRDAYQNRTNSTIRKKLFILGLASFFIASLAALSVFGIKRIEDTRKENQIIIQDLNVSDVSNLNPSQDLFNNAAAATLRVDGDLISTGIIKLEDSEGRYTSLVVEDAGVGDRVITFPNISGTVCLDGNNCGFTTRAEFDANADLLQQQIAGQTITNTVNSLSGNIVLQGTTNQITVSVDGQVIKISTSQDLAAISSPSFSSLNLSGNIVFEGATNNNFETIFNLVDPTADQTITLPDASGTVCLSTNNCDFSSGSGMSFLQGGNSFGAIAILGTNDGNDLQLETNGVTRLTVQSDGDIDFDSNTLFVDATNNRVGIGTSTPLGKFDIYGAGFSTSELIYTGLVLNSEGVIDGAGNYGVGIEFTKLGSPTVKKAGIAPVQSTADRDTLGMAFFVSGSTSTNVPVVEAMRIDGLTGNVGIGTTSPEVKLEVQGGNFTVSNEAFVKAEVKRASNDSGGAEIRLHKTRGTLTTPLAVQSGDLIGAISFVGYNGTLTEIGSQIYGYAAENWTGSANGSLLTFRTVPVGSAFELERVRIDANGNVGIGDTSPAALFTVGNGDLFQVASNGNLTTSNAGSWTFSNDTNFVLSGGVNGLSFDGTTLSIDATNDRVGIGTAAPTSQLDQRLTSTLTSGSYYNRYNELTLNAGASSSVSAFASSDSIVTNSGNAQNYTGFVTGYNGGFTHQGTGTVSNANGGQYLLVNTSSGVITQGNAILSRVVKQSTGSITEASGITLRVDNTSATGSIGTYYGARVADVTNTGTITNTVGFYVGDITAGTQTNTPFSFYASDPNALNYFAGNVGIGDTTPAALFTVGSGDLFQVASNGNLTTSNAGTWTFSNDTNFALSGGVNGLSFDGTTLSVDATNDRVGIGTAAPTAPLEVVGPGTGAVISLTSPINTQLDLISTGTGGGIWRFASLGNVAGREGNFELQDNSNNARPIVVRPQTSVVAGYKAIYIDSNGRVGIGNNTAPAALFTVGVGDLFQVSSAGLVTYVNGATDTDTLVCRNATGQLAACSGAALTGTAFIQNGNSFGGLATLGTNDANALVLETSGAERLRIDTSGNVGVGTNSPQYRLHVSGGNRTIALGTNLVSGGYTGLQLALSAESGGYAEIQAIESSGSTFGNLILNRQGGNVGIGDAGPTVKLSVVGSANGIIQSLRSTGTAAGLRLQNDTNSFGIYTSDAVANDGFGIYDIDNTAYRLAIDGNSGNVGIGDTTPAYLLTVGNGDLFGVNSSGNLVWEGSTADAFETTLTVVNPTADVNYRLADAAAGTYDLCSTAGNCLSGGGAATLQSAYNAGNTITGTTGRNISITLADLATDQTLEVTQAGTADAFRVNDDGTFSDTTPFVISASGSVGIGASSPGYKLEVTGNGYFSSVLAVNGVDPTVTGNKLVVRGGLYANNQDGGISVVNATDTSQRWESYFNNKSNGSGVPRTAIGFISRDASNVITSSVEAISINTIGSVGIGTNNPSSFKLQVAGSIGPDADDTYDLGSNANRWQDLYLGPQTLHIGTSTSDEGTISYNTTSNILQFDTDSTSNGDIAFFTDDLYLDKSTGNVGIGTTTPNTKLSVNGGNNIDPIWPDGQKGSSITQLVNSTTSYTVPAGKTLYITSVQSTTASAFNVDGVAVMMVHTSNNVNEPLGQPILVAAGGVVDTGSGTNTFINGLLVNEGVTPVTQAVNNVTSYTVPAGKRLVILNAYATSNLSLLFDGNSVFEAYTSGNTNTEVMQQPLFADAGVVISNASGTLLTINGYLTDINGFGGADLAERYLLEGYAEAGDVLEISPNSTTDRPLVRKAMSAFAGHLLGVYTTAPFKILSDKNTADPELNTADVALVGRVPVKVTMEGGQIKSGDPLTSSSKAGYAMKANGKGKTLGLALEDFNCGTDDCEGTIMTFIDSGYSDGKTIANSLTINHLITLIAILGVFVLGWRATGKHQLNSRKTARQLFKTRT